MELHHVSFNGKRFNAAIDVDIYDFSFELYECIINKRKIDLRKISSHSFFRIECLISKVFNIPKEVEAVLSEGRLGLQIDSLELNN